MRKILHEGKYIRLVSERGWEFVERANCNGIVIVVAKNRQEKIILVEQYRAPVAKNVIEFPAGLVADGDREEKLEEAARREFLEETGYEAKRMIHLVTGPVNTGLSADVVTFFRAVSPVKKSAGGGADPEEKITVHEVPISKIRPWLGKMQKKGCLIDPKVYVGLYFLNVRSAASRL